MEIFLVLVAAAVVLIAAFVWRQRGRRSVGDSTSSSRQSSRVESRLRDGRADDPQKMGGTLGR